MKNPALLLICIVLALNGMILTSCERDTIDPDPEISSTAIIVNEGPFQEGSGSLTVFDRETGETQQNVFESANGRPLGSIVQSVAIYGEKAFISVNNSNRLEVANYPSFASEVAIDVTLPRYFLKVSDDMGYVTSWNDAVYVIDLHFMNVTDTIGCPTGPDQLIELNGYVFVLNSGGFGTDNRVSVIDPVSDEIVKVIEVGDNPAGVVSDEEGMLWVLCSGKGWNGFPAPDDTPGSLVRIDPDQLVVSSSITLESTDIHPAKLAINKEKDQLFILFPDGIYTMSVQAGQIAAEPLIQGAFYGMNVDPGENVIYATDPVDYVQNGWVMMYDFSGTRVDSVKAGVIPSSVAFK